MPTNTESLTSIATKELSSTLGGASRVTSRSGSSNDQLTMMLTQITSSIKDLAGNKNQSDPSMMMMMAMMMGGGGGGGGGAPAAAPPPPAPAAPVVSIKTSVR